MIIPLFKNRLEKIENLILDSDEIYLAISFIRYSGIKLIRPIYLQSNMNFKIIVDTKLRITEKNALLQLLDDGFVIKEFKGKGSFHPKVWVFKKNNKYTAIIGSMNLSLSALKYNIEACLLLDGDNAMIFMEWFNNLWNDENLTSDINRIVIEQMSSAIPFIYSMEGPETVYQEHPLIEGSDLTNEDVLNFIKDWTHDQIRITPGPLMRKTGWFFRPAHGDINQNKLEELQRVLYAAFLNNKIHFELTEDSATNIINQANIVYQRGTHLTSDRDRLIRQQINYLEKLDLIAKDIGDRSWNTINLTPLGRAYIRSQSDKLKNFVISALVKYEWFGVNIYDFTKSVLQMITDHKVHYDEYFLFLRHGGITDYHFHLPKDIVTLINTFRTFNDNIQNQIWSQMETWVNMNDNSPSRTSLTNMKNNWAPNMFNDLAICDEFEIVNNYLQLKSSDR